MVKKNIKVGIGYNRTVWYDKALEFMPYASAGIMGRNGEKALVSYETAVCGIDNCGNVWCNGTYSATTRKHIAAFCKEVFGTDSFINYQFMKCLFEKDEKYNVKTGDFISASTGEVLRTVAI